MACPLVICGRVGDMVSLFDTMHQVDRYGFTTVIHVLAGELAAVTLLVPVPHLAFREQKFTRNL